MSNKRMTRTYAHGFMWDLTVSPRPWKATQFRPDRWYPQVGSGFGLQKQATKVFRRIFFREEQFEGNRYFYDFKSKNFTSQNKFGFFFFRMALEMHPDLKHC